MIIFALLALAATGMLHESVLPTVRPTNPPTFSGNVYETKPAMEVCPMNCQVWFSCNKLCTCGVDCGMDGNCMDEDQQYCYSWNVIAQTASPTYYPISEGTPKPTVQQTSSPSYYPVWQTAEPTTMKLPSVHPTKPPSSPPCAPGCPDAWIGDNYCDQACLTEACSFDGNDCMATQTASPTYYPISNDTPKPTSQDTPKPSVRPTKPPTNGPCAPGCRNDWIGDNYCDLECNNEACSFDGNDCMATQTASPTYYPISDTPKPTPQGTKKKSYPPSVTPTNSPSNGGECAPGCPDNWIGDNYCDSACNVAECLFDLLDCMKDTEMPSMAMSSPPSVNPTFTPTFYPTKEPTMMMKDPPCEEVMKGKMCRAQERCRWRQGKCIVSKKYINRTKRKCRKHKKDFAKCSETKGCLPLLRRNGTIRKCDIDMDHLYEG